MENKGGIMTKITSSKMNTQKLAKGNLPKYLEKVLKDVQKSIVNKELLVDANCLIPASQIGASRNLTLANEYLAKQAAKTSSEKMAAEKLNKLTEIL